MIDKVIFENVVRFRHLSIPYQAAYIVFFAASLAVLLTVLRPTAMTSTYFFGLVVILVATAISVREMISTLRRIG